MAIPRGRCSGTTGRASGAALDASELADHAVTQRWPTGGVACTGARAQGLGRRKARRGCGSLFPSMASMPARTIPNLARCPAHVGRDCKRTVARHASRCGYSAGSGITQLRNCGGGRSRGTRARGGSSPSDSNLRHAATYLTPARLPEFRAATHCTATMAVYQSGGILRLGSVGPHNDRRSCDTSREALPR